MNKVIYSQKLENKRLLEKKTTLFRAEQPCRKSFRIILKPAFRQFFYVQRIMPEDYRSHIISRMI